MRRPILLFALLLAASFARFTRAQQPPELERGFKPELVYQFNGFDSVNLFNGNLNLSIPLGSYPVSSDVSYSFALQYAGNVWSYYWDCPESGPADPNPPPCTIFWYPAEDNAGMGWSLSFGRLEFAHSTYGQQLPPAGTIKYVSPDGGEHLFYETLHEPKCSATVTTNCDDVVSGVYYTRDGTYLRMKTTAAGTDRVIEFPGGQKHRFSWSGISGELQYIYGASSNTDANGYPTTNFVRFEYPSNGDWKITDSHGREHWVFFNHTGDFSGKVDKVHLAAARRPEDPANQNPVAIFDLTYGEYTVSGTDGPTTSIPKPCDGNPIAFMQAQFLRRLDLPGNESLELTYQTSPTNCESPGTLTRATLPTGGNVNWTYQRYFFTTPDGISASTGVKERCLRRDSNPCSLTTQSAFQDEYSKYTPANNATTELVTTETYGRNTSGGWGLDSKTVSYFFNLYGAFLGLPVAAASYGVSDGRNLSSDIYDCSPDTGTCTLERKQFLKYEMDATAGCGVDYPCNRDRNRRVVSERTQFVTDDNRLADTNRSDFDGLGNYRKVTTEGFDSSAPVRETYTGFNLNTRNWSNWAGNTVGTYQLTSSGERAAGYTMLGAGDSWILGTFTTAFVRENGATSHSETCFNPTTGFVHRVRLKSHPLGVNQSGDLLRAFTRDPASGYASRQEFFGGDLQAVSTSPLCTVETPALDAYSFRTDHTYQYGVLKTSRYPDMSWYSVENSVIDQNTGLVRESRDAAGLATGYVYDRRGRLTRLSPSGLAATSHTYVPASASAAARVEAVTGSGTTRLEQQWEFDPFGRISREKQLMPAGWSVRRTMYNALGLRESISEWENETGATYATKTTYAGYDAFGRVGLVTLPDASTTTYTYTGSRVVIRTSTGGGIAPIPVISREEYDRYGRLASVQENSGPAGQAVTTAYVYDQASRLTGVKMNSTGNIVQNRMFDYDGRGFLRWESQPESGMRSYKYDARGHVRTIELGAAQSPFDLKYAYDSAERLTAVDGRNPSDPNLWRPFKAFTYGDSNDTSVVPADYRRGKLWTAVRYNYPPASSGASYMQQKIVRVTETYGYRDAAGRRTHRSTDITAADDLTCCWHDFNDTIKQSVQYDALGQPEVIVYPLCENCGMPESFPPRDVKSVYQNGYLTSLQHRLVANGAFANVLSSLTYWPNGMRNAVTHSNGIVDTQTVDASGMARPGTLLSERYNSCTGPTIVQQTMAATVSSSQPSTNLSVTVGGTAPMSYEWYKVGTSQAIGGATGSTYAASPAAEAQYYVVARNACAFVRSKSMTVKVGECVPPWIAEAKAARNADGTFSLRSSAGGTGTVTYTWRRTSDNAVVSTGKDYVTPVLTVTTAYQLTVTVPNGCSSTSAVATVTASLSLGTATVTATRSATNPTQVEVAWSPVPDAESYAVERRGPGTGWETIANSLPPSTNQISNGGLSLNSVYAYRVITKAGDVWTTSVANPATTLTFSQISNAVSASHFNEMLGAVNAARATAGWPSVTWQNILGPTDPIPAPGTGILARHLIALRSRLNEALHALGVAAGGYADSDPQFKAILATHLTEMQGRLQ